VLAVGQVPLFPNEAMRQAAVKQYGSTPAVRNFNPGNITDL